MNIAVIGLGTMGGRVAAKLLEAGHTVCGFDPQEEARSLASNNGATVFESAEEAVSEVDMVILSLPRPEHVISAAEGALALARSGTVVVDLSTIDKPSAQKAAETLAKSGVSYVDAPVLGRPNGIGAWTLPVGGSPQAFARTQEVLEGSVAKWTVHVGDVGSGSVVKLLNNLMYGAINAVTAEVLNACRLSDVAPEVFSDTLASSGAATISKVFTELAPKIIQEDYEPAFSLSLMAKDNRLALELERDLGAPTLVASAVDSLNTIALNRGLGSLDTCAVYEVLKTMSRNN